MTTGEKIKKARKEAGLTQQKLGEKLGVSAAMIAQYENGTRNPKLTTLDKIADALEISVKTLLGDKYSVSEIDVLETFADKIRDSDNPYTDFFRNVAAEIDEQRLLERYRSLNADGQLKIIDYAELLTKIPEYQRPKN